MYPDQSQESGCVRTAVSAKGWLLLGDGYGRVDRAEGSALGRHGSERNMKGQSTWEEE